MNNDFGRGGAAVDSGKHGSPHVGPNDWDRAARLCLTLRLNSLEPDPYCMIDEFMPTPPGPSEESPTDWDIVAGNPEFKDLMVAKARFIVPATVFFIAYYFALPILVGYAPDLMATPVIGPVNLAYLFALSQFFVAWIIAWLYVRAAERFDRMAASVVAHLGRSKEQR